MAHNVQMLALSPTMDSGTIAKWNRAVGDQVKTGDALCDVETDKTTMELESPADGTLLTILVPEGDDAEVGALIAIIGEPDEDIAALAVAPESGKPATPDRPDRSDRFDRSDRSDRSDKPATPKPAPGPDAGEPLRSSPLARRLARDAGLDLGAVSGSGPRGRIVKRDIETARAAQPAGASAPRAAAPAAKPGQRLPLSRTRRTIATRLAKSMTSAPHYYLTVDVTVDELLAARTRINSEGGDKLSLNAFLVKFAAEALRRHPLVNATWDDDAIQLFATADIGLAVAVPDGLVTPIVRDSAAKGIRAINDELRGLIEKAKAGRLAPEEYTGATFTISNLGSFGIRQFTAVINPPGSAILAVGAVRREPVVGPDDAVRVASRLTVTLSCDHRVIDGAVGAAFLANLTDMIANPILALL